MKHRYGRFIRFVAMILVAIVLVFSVLGCASRLSLDDLRALNPGAQVIEPCVRPPTVEWDARFWAYQLVTNRTVSDRNPDELEAFAKTADYIFRFDPNAPRGSTSGLPWPYHHMQCATLSSSKTAPLPAGLPELPLTPATQEALVAILSQECAPAPSPPQQSVDKRLLGQVGMPISAGNRNKFTVAQAEKITQVLRDELRNVTRPKPLPDPATVINGVFGTHLPLIIDDRHFADDAEAVSIVDTPAGQVFGGGLSAVPPALAPGGTVISQALIDNGIVPKGTRWARLGKGLTETVVGGVEVFVGIDGAIVGGGMSLTGGGAVAGVPLCIGGVALATNGATVFCNGVKTLAIVFCRWEDEESVAAMAATPAPTATTPAPAAKPTTTPATPPKAATPAPAAKPASPSATTSTTPVKGQPSAGTGTTAGAPAPGSGQTLRNAHLAGKKHPKTGVPFDKDGYPDFRAAGLVEKEVKIKFSGDRKKDIKLANDKVGLTETPKDCTWHHHQDGTTMQLVPTTIHKQTGHTGGFSGTSP